MPLRIAIGFALLITLVACHTSKKITNPAAVIINKTDSLAGLALVGNNDCYTCHEMDKPMIGTTFTRIASKYDPTTENIDKLSNKILNGGRGNWGEVPMVPHPKLSGTDAKTIVKYILSLKK